MDKFPANPLEFSPLTVLPSVLVKSGEVTVPTPNQPAVDHLEPEVPLPDKTSWLSRAYHTTRNVGMMAVVTAELLPVTNEIPRLDIYGAASAHAPGNWWIGALAAGLPTALIEGASGMATASLLASDRSAAIFGRLVDRVHKIGVPVDKELSTASKAFWTFLGGAPVGVMLEQRENPQRTVHENRKFTALTAAWQAGVLAVAGAGGEKTFAGLVDNPVRDTLVAGGLAAAVSAGSWLYKKGADLVHKLHERDYDLQYTKYAALLSDYGKDSPQHQGLTAVDYKRALGDQRTVTTDIQYEGKSYAFPQLVPPQDYEWLNERFYASRFSNEYAQGNILHFTDLPSVVPGPRVRERLQKLADENGVLTFDYPSSDPEYIDRVQALLVELGIDGTEVKEIGQQSYFAGQTRLAEYNPNAPALSLTDAYTRLVADGSYDPQRVRNGASLATKIPSSEAEVMHSFYNDAYEIFNDDPCNQGLDPDQFFDMMTRQPDVVKIINRRGDKATALCILSNKLDDLDWVNSDYYRKNFPDQAANDQIYWFPGLAADPTSSQGHNLLSMIKLIAEVADKGNNELLVVFDSCTTNTGHLDVAIEKIINRTSTTTVSVNQIAAQKYYAIRTSRKQ